MQYHNVTGRHSSNEQQYLKITNIYDSHTISLYIYDNVHGQMTCAKYEQCFNESHITGKYRRHQIKISGQLVMQGQVRGQS